MKDYTLPIKKIITVILVIVVLFFVAIFVGGLVEVNREQVYLESTPVDQPIRISAMTFAELDRLIQSDYPQYCDGMILVDATAQIEFRGNAILQCNASLIYYRYIDNSMEGGNVEKNECRFDLITNTFVSVEHESGSGRSISVSENALSENIVNFPLDQYVVHATELTDIQSDCDYMMEMNCTQDWMKLEMRTVQDRELLYRETLTRWPDNDKFSERTFEMITD